MENKCYKRVVLTEYGGPDVLKVVEEPNLPEPQNNEVRIKVLATSVALTDTLIRQNRYPALWGTKPPFSPGYDMVGIVDKLGKGVSKFKIGQKVAELTVIGSYSEYICLHEDQLVPVPDALDAAEAVSMILSYMTAYQMLYRNANLQNGQRILILGAGGAVGTALIQLGKINDLEMYGTDSIPKHELITNLGATPIDYKNEDVPTRIKQLTGDGVDAVFDGVAGKSFAQSFRMLRDGGMLVAYGGLGVNSLWGGLKYPIDLQRLKLWNWLPNGRFTSFYSIATLRKKKPDWFYEDLTELFNLLNQGKIKPVIAKRFPLTEAANAHKLLERRGIKGKIVLTMNNPT
ncbi:MAG: medium chain dehydrogenase/reductase family protein [Chloroflexota bacterium]